MSRQSMLDKESGEGRTAGFRLLRRRRESGRARRRATVELARRLGDFPAFAGCQTDDLAALAAAGRVTSLPAQWTFLHAGTPADGCYVLLEGTAQVLGGGRPGALGPGSVLGEMGLLGKSLRRASVVTSTAVSALHVDYDALAAVLLAHPQLAECLDAVYAQHRDADRRTASIRA